MMVTERTRREVLAEYEMDKKIESALKSANRALVVAKVLLLALVLISAAGALAWLMGAM